MFNLLPYDIILLISSYFDTIIDVNNLISINKTIYKEYNNDTFYLDWGRNIYTKDFWDKAKKRSKILVKPYYNMKVELLRIERFQEKLEKSNMELWNNQDFYKYWNNLETLLQTKGNVKWKKKQPIANTPNNKTFNFDQLLKAL